MAFMIPPVYNTEQPVGNNESNNSSDVRLLQGMLVEMNRAVPGWAPATPLSVDGTYTPNLAAWIGAFQSHLRSIGAPVVVDHKIHPMPMTAGIDYSSRFRSGVGSTLFALNYNLRRSAKSAHQNLGGTLGIAEKEL